LAVGLVAIPSTEPPAAPAAQPCHAAKAAELSTAGEPQPVSHHLSKRLVELERANALWVELAHVMAEGPEQVPVEEAMPHADGAPWPEEVHPALRPERTTFGQLPATADLLPAVFGGEGRTYMTLLPAEDLADRALMARIGVRTLREMLAEASP
jgi:hypothetical protein